jgi:hypothetical protein
MNNELGKIWKMAVVAHIERLPQRLSGGTEENKKKLSG